MKFIASTGIRSEYDILHPVITELISNNHSVKIVVSGAHLSNSHHNTYDRIEKDGFEIADKIDSLLPTDRSVQRSKGVGLLIQALSQTVEREDPDFLLVVGDREESIATAIVGNYMQKLVVHIGGGDPVYGNADDPVRFAVSKLSHIHCCTADAYAKNLLKIGEEEFRIFFTGNPSYVNIEKVENISINEIFQNLDIPKKNYIVLIKHPLSSEVSEAKKQMQVTLESLKIFCEKNNYQVLCIPPNSDPGSYEMRQVISSYSNEQWFIKLDTIPRLQFINIMRHSMALVGNSSMGILEAPYYGIPVVNIGKRQLGRLNAGNVEFVGYDSNEIVNAVERALLDEKYRTHVSLLKNPYGDSTAARKIRQAIDTVDLNDNKWYKKQKLV